MAAASHRSFALRLVSCAWSPDFPEQSQCFAGPRPRPGFWQPDERRESLSRAGRRLHSGHPAKAEGREEQREWAARWAKRITRSLESGVWFHQQGFSVVFTLLFHYFSGLHVPSALPYTDTVVVFLWWTK